MSEDVGKYVVIIIVVTFVITMAVLAWKSVLKDEKQRKEFFDHVRFCTNELIKSNNKEGMKSFQNDLILSRDKINAHLSTYNNRVSVTELEFHEIRDNAEMVAFLKHHINLLEQALENK